VTIKATIRRYIEQRMEHYGFVRHELLDAAERSANNERSAKMKALNALEDAKTFMAEKLSALTQLDPTMRWPNPQERYYRALTSEPSRHLVLGIIEGRRRDVVLRVTIPAVLDFWMYRRDYSAIDDALRYIGEAVAYQVTKELRFGLTGGNGTLRKAGEDA